MSSFQVKGLSIKRSDRTLIHDLSFKIEGPFFLAVIGDNGSGKTSFLKAILQQVPYQGELIHKPTLTNVGYISQKNHLQFDMKVKDLVVMGAYKGKSMFDNYTLADYQKVKELLAKVGLTDKYDASYTSLSGGEQQLVWLAQQLMLSPQLLLLDEPTANLDVKNKALFFNQIMDLVEQGKQVICVTHDLFFLREMKGYCLNVSNLKVGVTPLSSAEIDAIYKAML